MAAPGHQPERLSEMLQSWEQMRPLEWSEGNGQHAPGILLSKSLQVLSVRLQCEALEMLPLHQPSHYRRVSKCASRQWGAFLPELYDVKEAWGEYGHREESGALPRPPNGCMFLSLVSSSLRSPSGSKRLTLHLRFTSLSYAPSRQHVHVWIIVSYMFLRHICPCFAHAHLLDVSEGFDHGGKGLLHFVSPQHMFEWEKHTILLLKLTEGNLRVACSPA